MNLFQIGLLFSLPVHTYLLTCETGYWSIFIYNVLKVNGKEVPGPLFDFGLLMYHNARILLDNESGPFFYLSKVS
jgi:hypothetical protein